MALFDFVQTEDNWAASDSVVATFAGAVAAGNIVFVMAVCYADVTSVTDNKGNTYTGLGSVGAIRYYYALNVIGGSGFAVTVEATGAAQCTAVITEFEGDASVTLDTWKEFPYDPAPIISISSGNLSTSNAVELLIAVTVIGAFGGIATITSYTSGFTARSDYFNGDYFRIDIRSQVTSASGSYGTTAGLTSNSAGSAAFIGAFTSSGGGGHPWYAYAQQ